MLLPCDSPWWEAWGPVCRRLQRQQGADQPRQVALAHHAVLIRIGLTGVTVGQQRIKEALNVGAESLVELGDGHDIRQRPLVGGVCQASGDCPEETIKPNVCQTYEPESNRDSGLEKPTQTSAAAETASAPAAPGLVGALLAL